MYSAIHQVCYTLPEPYFFTRIWRNSQVFYFITYNLISYLSSQYNEGIISEMRCRILVGWELYHRANRGIVWEKAYEQISARSEIRNCSVINLYVAESEKRAHNPNFRENMWWFWYHLIAVLCRRRKSFGSDQRSGRTAKGLELNGQSATRIGESVYTGNYQEIRTSFLLGRSVLFLLREATDEAKKSIPFIFPYDYTHWLQRSISWRKQ